MTYLDRLKAMSAECGLDWETAQHMTLLSFAALLDACRNKNQQKKEKDHAQA